MRSARVRVCAAILIALAVLPARKATTVRAQPADHHIIFDTDFALPPQDDGLALAFALNSPELDIVGITTVAGNYNLARANADVLRMLEIAKREDVKVYSGAKRPLVHQKDAFATSHYGKWWSDDAVPAPPGGFATKTVEAMPAADFIARTALARPGQIEILAIGPLTNVATVIQQQPAFANAVKRIIIMGGAIASCRTAAATSRRTPNSISGWTRRPRASSCGAASRSCCRR